MGGGKVNHLNNLDPELIGEQIFEMKQTTGLSVCESADRVFAVLATARDAQAVAGNGSRGSSQPPPEPLGSV